MSVWRTVIRRAFAVVFAILGLGIATWSLNELRVGDLSYLALLSLGIPCLSWAWLLWQGCSFRQLGAVLLMYIGAACIWVGVDALNTMAGWQGYWFAFLAFLMGSPYVALGYLAWPRPSREALTWESVSGAAFYVTGGTLHHDAPSYVPRRADGDLYHGLRQGEFCYVLTSRQMGKSSLMVRTALRLREAGAQVALLDLTALGQNVSPEQWYEGLLLKLGEQLGLEEAVDDYWLANERIGPLQRWQGALRDVVLARGPGPVVVFVDELDVVTSLTFSTDEFFAGIRECYNRRANDPEMRRLTFCLLGVASPSELIRDVRMTPFNIGRRIVLADFTEGEAAPLARGMDRPLWLARLLLRRVLYWTGGHPYLTQRLCRAIAEDPGVRSRAGVDRLCESLFLSPRAQERDDNLLFVRERLLRTGEQRDALLALYGRVLARQRVWDDEADPLVGVLRLAGVVRNLHGRLAVRNRIYARVFDRAWVRENLPGAEVRRQETAYRQGVRRMASATAIVLGTPILTLGLWLVYIDLEPAETIPPQRLPSPNGYDRYRVAAKAVVGPALLDPRRQGDRIAVAEQRSLLDRNAAALRTLRDGFRYDCVQPRDYYRAENFGLYPRFTAVGTLLRFEGDHRRERGDIEGASRSYLDAVALGGELSRGALVLGFSCQRAGREALWQLLPRLNAAQALTAVRRMETVSRRHIPFAARLREEKRDQQERLLAMFRRPWWRAIYDDYEETRIVWDPTPRRQKTRLESVVNVVMTLYATKRHVLDDVTHAYDLGVEDTGVRYDPSAPDRARLWLEGRSERGRGDWMGSMYVLDFPRSYHSELRSLAQNSLLTAALAVHAYRKTYRTCPATLDALVPAFLSRVPEDPYAPGKPVRYQRQGKGYLLYSLGPDAHDDGGKQQTAGEGLNADDKGDLLAGPEPPPPPAPAPRRDPEPRGGS